MTDHHDTQAAAGAMRIAARRLLRDFPLHAGVLAGADFRPDPAVRTMGVTVRGGAVCLVYHPGFVLRCSLDELATVLQHEVNHVIFGHVTADPADYPDAEARLIAEEVTVNEWVRGPLPGRPILLSQYPHLPPNEDTATRYSRLAMERPDAPEAGAKAGSGQERGGTGEPETGSGGTKRRPPGRFSGPAGGKSAPSGRKNVPPGQNPPPPAANSGQDSSGQGDPAIGGESLAAGGRPTPTDDHSLWAEARAGGALTDLVIRANLQGALESLTPAQRAKVPAGLRARVERLGRGDAPGGAVEELGGGRGTIDWRRALRRHVARATEVFPSYGRPPRRFPHLVGIVPGMARRPDKARVMAVIDTSGSVRAEELVQIAEEVGRMSRSHEVVVVECDAAVQRVYPYRGRIGEARGRGGTDFRPPLAADFLRQLRPDVIVYFTDGDGPAPERRPSPPVVWCLVPGGRRPAPWGKVVWMGD